MTSSHRQASAPVEGGRAWAGVALVLALASVGALAMFANMSERGDEVSHYPQVLEFLAGRFGVRPDLTMLPGYHAVLAALGWLTGAQELGALRLVSFGLGLVAVLSFAVAARTLHAPSAPTRTLQFFLFPLICPFLFLVYSDVFALAPLLLGLALLVRRRWSLAGVVSALSLLIRQSHVVWLACFVVLGYARRYGWRVRIREALGHAVVSWPFVLAGAAFVGFVIWNGGVALGDKADFESGLYVTNLWFGLGVFPLLLLPVCLARLPSALASLRSLGTWAMLAVVAVAYAASWKITHGDNTNIGNFVHNYVAVWADSGPGPRVLFFVPIASSVLLLREWRLPGGAGPAILAFWALSVLPLEMVEFRYHLVPLVFFLLLRPLESRRVEVLTALWFAGLSGGALLGIQTAVAFP